MSIALTGITCGSFAWFMYTTRAQIEEFEGVTLGVGNLQAGIISEVELPDAEQHGLIKDDSYEGQTIYWFDGHEIEPSVLNYVLSSNGYATNTFHPVTTSQYANGSNFTLLSAPTMLKPTIDEPASKESYIHLPLVFRYEDLLEEGVYISDENIYLSEFKFNTLFTNSYIHEAVRIHTNNNNDLVHLINPSSSEDGSTDVGGTLDLNGDGFYDTLSIENNEYERVYGEVQESDYKADPESDDTIVYPDQRTTFNAGHKAGTYALESISPCVAEFEGFYGFRNKRKPVTITNSLTDNLAYLDLSIFVEGWDIHVIDSEIGIPFSMELKFSTEL